MTSAADLQRGSWSARWGNWVVGLRSRETGWQATVWRWLPGRPLAARHQLDQRDGFELASDAVTWAAGVMRGNGAVVMVLDAPNITLERMLSFVPAPEVVD